jgi:putative OPT family oligopeptide transporter
MSAPPPPSTAPPAKVEPFIPASQSLPELTVGVILLGSLLSIVLGAANAYLGMFAGMTVSASIPAAVLSMAILRYAGGNILQNNGVQTAAASGAGIAAGVIFTIPAMVLLGAWAKFNYLETTLIAGFGGILGVLFTIPLRRALIIEQPLQFPEGVATAEVLKVGARGGAGIGLVVTGGLLGAVFKLGATGLRVYGEVAQFVTTAGGSVIYVGSNLSPALLGVGFIVGLNVAVVIFAGAVVNRWIATPIMALTFDDVKAMIDAGAPAGDVVGYVHGRYARYLGVGGMLVGGLWSLVKLRKPILTGIRGGLEAVKKARAGGSESIPRTERDIPMNIVLILIGLSTIPLFFIFHHFTKDVGTSIVMALVMLVAGFLFSAVASYMAGLVGSSNNPVSGITISTILVSALLLQLLGQEGQAGASAAILIGGVVCCAAAIGGDNLQDLKCGQLVGSTPYKQQFMQILGVVVAALVMAPVLDQLHSAYTIGSAKLPAPQANLMKDVSMGVFKGGLPLGIIAVGAAIAVGLIIVNEILEKKQSSIRTPVMAFAVGVYLPFDLSAPILLGGIISHLFFKHLAKTRANEHVRGAKERNGLLFAAGLITGEALMGIGLAIPIGIEQDTNALALFDGKYGELPWPGLALVAAVMYLMYRAATKAVPEEQ